MEITDYHAKKLYAHKLTRRCASDESDKMAPVLPAPPGCARKAGENFKKIKTV